VVENFRPGVAARLGLGAEALRKANPRLIYCSISGFGQEGPFKDLPAYDLVVQAMSGLMAATGENGGAPLKTGESIADLIAGLFASWSIMAALVSRNATGQGTTLDVAMYDALFSMLTTSHAQHFYGGVLPGRVGNRHPLSTPFGCFRTRDGQVVIAVLNGGQFERLAGFIGKPEIAGDPRFATDSSRTEHEPALRALIEEWTGGLTTEEAVAALAAQGLPTAPIWDIAQAADNEHTAARGLVSMLAHPVLGQAPVVGQPVRFDGAKPVASAAAPRLGGDIEAVLKEFGLENRA
jgi:CoA:oxalate CoA-transferase